MMEYSGSNATELGTRSAGVASNVMYGKLVGVMIGGVTFIIVAKLLGASGYGIYTLALGAAGAFGAFANLSIGQYFQKQIPGLSAKNDWAEISRVIGSGTVIMLAVVVALTAVGLAFSTEIAGLFGGAGVTEVIEIALLSIISTALFSNLYSGLIAFGEGYKSAVANIANTSVQFLVSVGLVLLGFGAGGAVAGVVVGQMIGAGLMFIWINRRTEIRVDLQHLRDNYRKMLSFSVPLTGSSIVSGLGSSVPVLLLGAIVSTGIVGSYGVSVKMWNFIDIIVGSISIVLIPMFAAAYSQERIKSKIDRLFSYSLYFGFLFTTPAIVYMIVFSGNIVNVLFSPTYPGAALYISLAAVSLLIGIIGIFGTALATSNGDVMEVFIYSVVTFAVELLLIWALVSYSGRLGIGQVGIGAGFVAAVSIAGSITTDLLYMHYIKSKLKLRVNYNVSRVLAANLVVGAIMAAVLYLGFSQFIQMVIGIAVLVVAYPPVIAYMRAINSDDIKILRESSKNIPVFGWIFRSMLDYAEFAVRT